MSITENLKKTIDDLQIERRLETLAQDLDQLYGQTRESVGGYISSREDDITALVDKFASSLDTRTEGRFSGEIGKVAGTVHRSVAKLAEQDPGRQD
jgi:hypothetical protein